VTRIGLSSHGTWSGDARVDVDVAVPVDANWTTSADFRKSFSSGTSLGGKAWELVKVPLASVRLPHAPAIQVQVEVELALACALDFDAELHAYGEVGVAGLVSGDVWYDQNANGPLKVGFAADAGLSKADQFHTTKPPRFAFKQGNLAQVSGRCSIQPSINARVGALAAGLADVGLKFIVEPYVYANGTFHSIDDWSIDTTSGVLGTVTPYGDFFGRHWQDPGNLDLKLFDYPLGSQTSRP
jgi:hypothetical protein